MTWEESCRFSEAELPYLHSLLSGMPLGHRVCECAIETIGTMQIYIKSSLQHSHILFPRPLSPTRNQCFASCFWFGFHKGSPHAAPSPQPTFPEGYIHTSSFPISTCGSITLLCLSYMLHPHEDLYSSLESLVKSGYWTSSQAFVFR